MVCVERQPPLVRRGVDDVGKSEVKRRQFRDCMNLDTVYRIGYGKRRAGEDDKDATSSDPAAGPTDEEIHIISTFTRIPTLPLLVRANAFSSWYVRTTAVSAIIKTNSASSSRRSYDRKRAKRPSADRRG
jgi:hypothetical protein